MWCVVVQRYKCAITRFSQPPFVSLLGFNQSRTDSPVGLREGRRKTDRVAPAVADTKNANKKIILNLFK